MILNKIKKYLAEQEANKKSLTIVKRLRGVDFVFDEFTGFNPNYRHEDQPLLNYFIKIKPELVHRLLETPGINIHAVDGNDNSALIIAIWEDQPEIMKTLVEKGVDINHQNKYGHTALHKAIKMPEELEYLLEHGADVHIKDKEGKNILTHAIWMQNSVMPLLLQYGADAEKTLKEMPMLKDGFGPAHMDYMAQKEGMEKLRNLWLEQILVKSARDKGVTSNSVQSRKKIL